LDEPGVGGAGISERERATHLFYTTEKKLLGDGICGIEVGGQVSVVRKMGAEVVLRPGRGNLSFSSKGVTSVGGEGDSAWRLDARNLVSGVGTPFE
jgi:hypothetical protein